MFWPTKAVRTTDTTNTTKNGLRIMCLDHDVYN